MAKINYTLYVHEELRDRVKDLAKRLDMQENEVFENSVDFYERMLEDGK